MVLNRGFVEELTLKICCENTKKRFLKKSHIENFVITDHTLESDMCWAWGENFLNEREDGVLRYIIFCMKVLSFYVILYNRKCPTLR